LLVKEMS